jgi:hypothetical protein
VTAQCQSKGTLKNCKNSTQMNIIICLDFVIFQLSMQGTNHIKAEKSTNFEVVSARLPCTDVSNRTDDEQLSDKIKNFIQNLPFIDMVTVWVRGACL